MALIDTMNAVYADVMAAYPAAGAAAPEAPANSRFALWFLLPAAAGVPNLTQASAIAAALRAKLGPQYVVGIGQVFLSVEFRPTNPLE
jgi:hypothetical protein